MNISNTGQYFPPTSVQGGKNVPPQPASQKAASSNDAVSPFRRVDMRNISLNEINELIRAGVDGSLDVVPITNIDITKINSGDESYRENFLNKKIDFLGIVENSIEFKKVLASKRVFLRKR